MYTVSTDIWLVTVEYFEEYKSLPNQTGLHEILFNLGANASYFCTLWGFFQQTRRFISYRTFGNAQKNDTVFRKHVAHKGNCFVQFVASVTSDICDVMQSQGTSPVSTKAMLSFDLVDFVFVICVISAGFSISPIVSFTR